MNGTIQTSIERGMRRAGWLLNRARRMIGQQPTWRCVVEHPISDIGWDRRRGIGGWVASDRQVCAIAIRSESGLGVPATFVQRPDVAFFLRYQFRRHTGFVCTRPVGEWLGTSASARLCVLIQFADGTSVEQAFAVVDPVDSRCAKLDRYRHLLRDPETGERLAETAEGFCSADGKRLFPVKHGMADFLPDNLKQEFAIEDTENVSSWGYDQAIVDEITAHPERLYLDCGAGLRAVQYPNVVNYEIVPYASTDVLGVAEKLPFANESVDGVISVAVLEHVKDPFQSAAELQRVLKPGGRLFCAVPFLQPRHGYPHHYYNMTAQGIVNLFPCLCVDSVSVPPLLHPMEALKWMLYAYAQGLPDGPRKQFEELRIKDVLKQSAQGNTLRQLNPDTMSTLAGGHLLVAHKPERS